MTSIQPPSAGAPNTSSLNDIEEELELSVVMPCLNEADTLGTCIEKALRAMREAGIKGEVVVGDNGSTDDSRAIAERLGARVVPVARRGYGSALIGGIAAARGKFVIMGDADDSYDFLQIPRFVEKLREGYDLVQGCRLPSGGGTVLPGAMPFLHRWWGNPMFSHLARWWFKAPIHDVYCGLRGFTKHHYESLDQRCTGMEFAIENVIKSSLYHAKIAEVPITLHPDGRKAHGAHLRTYRDGWRTLRFFLLYTPRWLFLVPGAVMMVAGIIASIALSISNVSIGNVTFSVHTLLYAAMAIVIGLQGIVFATFTKLFAISEGLLPPDERFDRMCGIITLEVGLIVGAILVLAGGGASIHAFNLWGGRSFGRLDPEQMLRIVIPAVTSLMLGFQVILASFFMSILGLRRR